MNQLAMRFMRKFMQIHAGAKYDRQYDLPRLYDSKTDSFHIEEVDDAYEEFKRELV